MRLSQEWCDGSGKPPAHRHEHGGKTYGRCRVLKCYGWFRLKRNGTVWPHRTTKHAKPQETAS